MSVLHDPEEFGRRVRSARGYMGEKKPGFAKAMGASVPTVTRWEDGAVGSIGATVPQRRQLAERIVDVTGCPPEWFELSALNGGAETELRKRIERLESVETKLRADLSTALLDLADARRNQGLPEHAEEGSGG